MCYVLLAVLVVVTVFMVTIAVLATVEYLHVRRVHRARG